MSANAFQVHCAQCCQVFRYLPLVCLALNWFMTQFRDRFDCSARSMAKGIQSTMKYFNELTSSVKSFHLEVEAINTVYANV